MITKLLSVGIKCSTEVLGTAKSMCMLVRRSLIRPRPRDTIMLSCLRLDTHYLRRFLIRLSNPGKNSTFFVLCKGILSAVHIIGYKILINALSSSVKTISDAFC